MPKTPPTAAPPDLRERAVSRLTGDGRNAHGSASQALAVLYELASSPSTAADALALLHELQVHQVELDLQTEELRGARSELEAALSRQIQLYESAPVGCFTIDAGGALLELNLTGAALLGGERDGLLGQSLYAFLAPDSALALRAALTPASEGRPAPRALRLTRNGEAPRAVYATVAADPASRAFLVAWMDAGPDDRAPARAPNR
ncbi:PAS domain-containing protein [Aquabacterium humicola]|uniref:PAS domain-containing protein n=1 Tax=Aquabacterium humicola TaxID=3237377 RepID=UPI002543F959|nr:PAS domain-containing protein [Rubrivivax pictus]